MRISPAFALIAALAMSPPAGAQQEFSKWPPGTSPKQIGERVARRFASSPHSLSTEEAKQPYINYPESVTWYGALTFAQLSGNNDLSSRLIQRFDPLLDIDSKLIPEPKHVDLTVFGGVPLEIYIETKQQKYLDLGRDFADRQWADPAPDGVTFPKPVLQRADGSFEEKKGYFKVPFTAAKAGKVTIGGTLYLSVCSDANCIMDKVPLEVAVDVK